ncbi:hypothetical protein H8S90_03765 [Olivibacter sp. SDN3]|uniref:chaperone modulator CbpM n=1 Tax=Olivibacter sp. SDN3 TaxID=2764720 RepID=UPI0016512625|nr:chaperone modulator CbpM [Olivibacter sp. SDN3]QNL50726.1 hypothetical protein H8S90_03765 [Olivibacter sp. SDN3]
METTLILISEYCTHCKVEQTFIQSLHEEGLIELAVVEKEYYISEEQLDDLEQFRRWYYDLHVNIEGIDAMKHLVQKLRVMQQEIDQLKNRLKLYES